MGTLRKRNNYWFIDLCIHGKRIRKKIGKDKKLAHLALQDLEVKLARNELSFVNRSEISIPDFFTKFLEYSQVNHRYGTTKRYRAVADNFLDFLKQKEPFLNTLSQITPDTIERYKFYRKTASITKNGKSLSRVQAKSINTGAKAHTINFELGTLRTALYLAVNWNHIQNNPVANISKLKTDDSLHRRFLTLNECDKLLKVSPEPYWGVFFTLLNTGMRLSELTNLAWSDLDLENRIIRIQKKHNWLPKTGERQIPINNNLWHYLATLERKSSLVFLQKHGKPLKNNIVRNALIRTAKKAGVENLTQVHSLRHTFASQLVMRGADLPSVQKLLGHSKIETTMIYAHQTQDHLKEAISKMQLTYEIDL